MRLELSISCHGASTFRCNCGDGSSLRRFAVSRDAVGDFPWWSETVNFSTEYSLNFLALVEWFKVASRHNFQQKDSDVVLEGERVCFAIFFR